MTKFILGPIQETWLKSLEESPASKQICGILGRIENGRMRTCCLGEGLLVIEKINNKESKFTSGKMLYDGMTKSKTEATGILENSYKELGLFDGTGKIMGKELKSFPWDTLSEANDGGCTWIRIAKFIRKYPEKVFNESK